MNKKSICNKNQAIIIFAVLILIGISFKPINALPNGVLVNPGISQTAPINGSVSIGAMAGNITELNIEGETVSQSWQGYFGNISGGFLLSDSNGSVLYNWSAVTANGEIYASKNSTIIWSNIQCFNFTAKGTLEDDSINRGNMSLYGYNETQIETMYNIGTSDVDGLSETFNLNNHEMFFTNNLKFDTGECNNAKLLNATGSGVFDEILLYSPDNKEIIFASILKESQVGFNNAHHDFQMLVLDDGHGSDINPTNYYFYMELG